MGNCNKNNNHIKLNEKEPKNDPIKIAEKDLSECIEINKNEKKKNRNKVAEKIKNMTRMYSKSSANLDFFVKSLSDVNELQKTYLDPSFLGESLNEFNNYENQMYDYDSEDEIDDIMIEGDTKEVKTILKKGKKFRLPVKFIIAEIVHSNAIKTLRQLFSPVLSGIPKYQKEFGMFHTAIIIGPWYLEWTDSSLVIPRKLHSSMALLSADVETGALLQNKTFDDICLTIAEVVCRWNINKVYCNINLKKKKDYGNCQEFIEDVMNALNIKFQNKGGAFWDFLNKMKKRGQCKMEFLPSKGFRKAFKVDKRYTFDTHIELDTFVTRISNVNDIALQIDYKEEYKLLKSFDRAFWLRHFKKPSLEKFKPLGNCPFKDPRKTQSYMTYH